MMETPIYRGKPPVIHNLAEYRRALEKRANEATLETTEHHKVDLWTLLPAQSIPAHSNPDAETVLIVLDGRGDLKIGGKSYEMEKDTLVTIPPGVEHSLWNNGPDTLAVLTIMGPGPFETKVTGKESEGSFY